jgi:ATP-dependent exoDNAse (exonuclease V) beta subunit
MPITPSHAETFTQCPRKYAFEHSNIDPGFREALHVGQAMHRTFEHLILEHERTGSWLELCEAASVLNGFLRDFPAGQPRPARAELETMHSNWFETGIRKLEVFFRNAAPIIENARVIDTEHWVRLDLLDPNGTIRASGKIDLLLEVNGEIWVMDFKTGRVKEALEQSYPLALYVTASRLEHPDKTVRAFEAYFEPFQMLEYNVDRLERDLENLAGVGREAFLEQEFLVRPSVLCAWCEFYAVCVGQAA